MFFNIVHKHVQTQALSQEHHFIVLESNGGQAVKRNEQIAPDPDASELLPPYKPDPTTPLYHDINELSTRRAVVIEENEYASVQRGQS